MARVTDMGGNVSETSTFGLVLMVYTPLQQNKVIWCLEQL